MCICLLFESLIINHHAYNGNVSARHNKRLRKAKRKMNRCSLNPFDSFSLCCDWCGCVDCWIKVHLISLLKAAQRKHTKKRVKREIDAHKHLDIHTLHRLTCLQIEMHSIKRILLIGFSVCVFEWQSTILNMAEKWESFNWRKLLRPRHKVEFWGEKSYVRQALHWRWVNTIHIHMHIQWYERGNHLNRVQAKG